MLRMDNYKSNVTFVFGCIIIVFHVMFRVFVQQAGGGGSGVVDGLRCAG